MASSVLVNVLVTTCILIRIYRGRRGVRILTRSIDRDFEELSEAKAEGGRENMVSDQVQTSLPQGYHNTASILLMETALPSAITGILACLAQPVCQLDACVNHVATAKYSIRFLWLWFTVSVYRNGFLKLRDCDLP